MNDDEFKELVYDLDEELLISQKLELARISLWLVWLWWRAYKQSKIGIGKKIVVFYF